MSTPPRLENGTVNIRSCGIKDAQLITELAILTFIESHGHSASKEDIENYVSGAFTPSTIVSELSDSNNFFFLLSIDDIPIGYSKLRVDMPVMTENKSRFCKLERIYLLAEYHGQGHGRLLMNHALDFAKEKDQLGMWLYTWVENQQAIDFYLRYGFKIIGQYDFKISATHVNPNHQMLLKW